jgi:hypothetical protein
MKDVAFALLSLVLCWLSLTEAEKAAEDVEMPRAIIHIGPHKTATTSLQAMLTTANSIANMQAENTYWMKQSEVFDFSKALFEVRQGSDDVAQMGRFFNESLRLGHNVVLSTENFVWMIPQQIQQLKDMLQGFDVTIVAVYREYTCSRCTPRGTKLLPESSRPYPSICWSRWTMLRRREAETT